MKYHPGDHQYTDEEMRQKIKKLRRQIEKAGGVDIVVTHAPPQGVGDGEDFAHQGFPAFLDFIDTYHPAYLLHGHIHPRYGCNMQHEREYHGTQVINVCDRYTLEVPDFPYIPQEKTGFSRLFHRKSEIYY